MKTLQECKDEVAKKHSFKDWNDLIKIHKIGDVNEVHEDYIDEKRMQELEHLINGQKWDIARWTKANREIDKNIEKLKV